MIMVDNLVYSYASNLENGVPIKPYIKGSDDCELEFLADVLENIDEGMPCSEFLEREFGFKKLYARG
jgi:TFIIF-interacting CTD phosphatase-like protein